MTERIHANARQLERFQRWLTAAGATVLPSTNEFELLRFTSSRPGVSIVYRRKAHTGCLTFTNEAAEAWAAFTQQPQGSSWTPGTAAPRRKVRLDPIIAALLKRDGGGCPYCGRVISIEAPLSWVVEHLLGKAFGGSDHVGNLALAHRACEIQANGLSVVEKMRLRDRLHAAGPAARS